MTICGFTGDNKAYASSAECMTACNGYAAGDLSALPAGPMATNTYACRRWHLNKANEVKADATMLKTHCGHTAMTSSTCI